MWGVYLWKGGDNTVKRQLTMAQSTQQMTEWIRKGEPHKKIKQDIVVTTRTLENSSSWRLCTGCRRHRDVCSGVWFSIQNLLFVPHHHCFFFSIQRCIMIFPLKNVLFSAIYEPREGWWIYALICALLTLSVHYSYSAFARNLEIRKHKSHPFLPWSWSKWKWCCLTYSDTALTLETAQT